MAELTGLKKSATFLSRFPRSIPARIGISAATSDRKGMSAIPLAPRAMRVRKGAVIQCEMGIQAQSFSSPNSVMRAKNTLPLLFVTAQITERLVSPKKPAVPKILPIRIPSTAPMINLEIRRRPPLFSTAGMSFTCRVVPIQNRRIPTEVEEPALEKSAVVSPPICSASGKNVFIRQPSSRDDHHIPSGRNFFIKFIIIINNTPLHGN